MRRWVFTLALSAVIILINWGGVFPLAEELPATSGEVYSSQQTELVPEEEQPGGQEVTGEAPAVSYAEPIIDNLEAAVGSSTETVNDATYSNTQATEQINAIVQEAPAAIQPTGLTANATGPNTVELSWNGAGAEDVLYQVYLARAEGAFSWKLNTQETRVTISNLMPVTEYKFYVQMVVSGQTSSPSDTVCVITPPSTSYPKVVRYKPNGFNTLRTAIIEVVWDDWLKPETINAESFYVTKKNYYQKVPGKYSWDENLRIMYFKPDLPWESNTEYVVKINSGIVSTSGIAARNTTFYFRTMAAQFISPHGTYLFSTAPCALCHSAHAAAGAKLINASTVAELCLSCHNGSGSVVVFPEIPETGHVSTANCCLCHNPHRPRP